MNRLILFIALFFTWFICIGQTETVYVTSMDDQDTLEVITVTPWQMDEYLLYTTPDFGDAMEWFLNPKVNIHTSEGMYAFMTLFLIIDIAPEDVEFVDMLRYSGLSFHDESCRFIPSAVIRYNPEYGYDNLKYLLK